MQASSDLCFEADLRAFYNRLGEVRHQPAPQTLEQFNGLLTGSGDRADPKLAELWPRIVQNPLFLDNCTHFFNRCCYILINHWAVQPNVRGASAQLVQQLGQVAQAEDWAQLSWSPALERFFRSSQFDILEQLIKADQPQSGLDQASGQASGQASEQARNQPLSQLIHRYPCLYPAYFTRYNSAEEGRRSVLALKEKQETAFDLKLLRAARHLGQSGAAGFGADAGSLNPTLLPDQTFASAIYEFSGAPLASHSYRTSARQARACIERSPSNRAMKGAIQSYLVDGLQAYGQVKGDSFNSTTHRFGSWIDHQLGGLHVELENQPPTDRSLVQTCGGLLNSVLAHPSDPNGLRNHAQFLNLVTNLGATFTIGLILKLLMICRVPKANLLAIRTAVADRFVRLFIHYESNPAVEKVSNVAWLVDCLDNYMVASTINFGSNPASMWNQMLRLQR